jgi:hypothetical protein
VREIPKLVSHCKRYSYSLLGQARGQYGGVKKEGMFHDVVENKWTKMSIFLLSTMSMNISHL